MLSYNYRVLGEKCSTGRGFPSSSSSSLSPSFCHLSWHLQILKGQPLCCPSRRTQQVTTDVCVFFFKETHLTFMYNEKQLFSRLSIPQNRRGALLSYLLSGPRDWFTLQLDHPLTVKCKHSRDMWPKGKYKKSCKCLLCVHKQQNNFDFKVGQFWLTSTLFTFFFLFKEWKGFNQFAKCHSSRWEGPDFEFCQRYEPLSSPLHFLLPPCFMQLDAGPLASLFLWLCLSSEPLRILTI